MPFEGEPKKVDDTPCPKCKGRDVTHQLWESSDGGHEDSRYQCACGHVWWIDGIDS